MYGLEVPQTFSGTRIERDDRIRKQILSGAVCAIMIELASPCGDICDAALLVDCQLIPVDGAAVALPEVFGPGLIAEFARTGYRMELPDELTGTNVICVNIARHV